MPRFKLEKLKELTPQEEREARRYQAACTELSNSLLQIATEYNVCPWCLLFHTGIAVKRAMDEGDIDHENSIMEH